MRVEAKGVALHVGSGGKNRTPFSGTLVVLDSLSDEPPAGAHGKRIIVTAAAGIAALPSLINMAVNLSPSFDGHSPKHKIGVIRSAEIIGGNLIAIAGFLYGADFPEEVGKIKAMKDSLGLSFEAEHLTFLDQNSPILTVTGLTFTGAAILLKNKAAFQTTSLAASAARAPDNIPPAAFRKAVGPHTKEFRHMAHNFTNAHPERASLKPFTFRFENPAGLLQTLEAIGFEATPAEVKANAAFGRPLGSGHSKFISEYELDARLAGFDIDLSRRLQLKAALSRQGLL